MIPLNIEVPAIWENITTTLFSEFEDSQSIVFIIDNSMSLPYEVYIDTTGTNSS